MKGIAPEAIVLAVTIEDAERWAETNTSPTLIACGVMAITPRTLARTRGFVAHHVTATHAFMNNLDMQQRRRVWAAVLPCLATSGCACVRLTVEQVFGTGGAE